MTSPDREYEYIELIVDELGEHVLSDLRAAASTQELPRLCALVQRLPPAAAEALVAQLLSHLENRDVVDSARIIKLVEICRLGARAVFAEGGSYKEMPCA